MLSPHALYPLVQTWLAVDHHRPPERVGAGTVRAARALAGRLGRADSAREGGACCGRSPSRPGAPAGAGHGASALSPTGGLSARGYYATTCSLL
jgi:hypothetical protein